MTQTTQHANRSIVSHHTGPSPWLTVPLAIVAFAASVLGALLSIFLIAVPFSYRSLEIVYWTRRQVDTLPEALVCAAVGLVLGALTLAIFNGGRALLRANREA